jgi:hypothetical protein
MTIRFLLATLSLMTHVTATTASVANVTISTSQDSTTLDMSTAGSCRPTLIDQFTRRMLHQVPPYEEHTYYLVTQKFVVGEGCFEGYNPALVTVQAQAIDVKTGRVGHKKLWSFSTAGIDGRVDAWLSGPLYRVDMPGCCAAEKTFKYFSLNTGRLVASSTVPLLQIDRTDTREFQYVGAESNLASSPQAPTKAMSTIFFGDNDGLIETVSISSPESYGSEDWGVQTLEFQSKPSNQASLVAKASDRPLLHIVLGCRCDAPLVDIFLPVARSGIDVSEEAKILGTPVELTTRVVARQQLTPRQR